MSQDGYDQTLVRPPPCIIEEKSEPRSFRSGGKDANGIPSTAFRSCSQSSAGEGTDWGTVRVAMVREYTTRYRGEKKKKGEQVRRDGKNFPSYIRQDVPSKPPLAFIIVFSEHTQIG